MAAPAIASAVCRLCGGRLDEDDDHVRRLHTSCAARPEAKRLGPMPVETGRPTAARAFTPAEKSLIRNVQAYMPPADLLRILNERLVADLGPDAPRYTMEQLHEEIGAAGAARASSSDWSGLRRVVAEARRSGVLAEVTPAVIDDFAIVFRLTPAQVTTLKDVIANAQAGGRR